MYAVVGLASIGKWLGAAAVLYVLSLGILIEYGGDYYSFAQASSRRRLLVHALLAMPLLPLLAWVLPDWLLL